MSTKKKGKTNAIAKVGTFLSSKHLTIVSILSEFRVKKFIKPEEIILQTGYKVINTNKDQKADDGSPLKKVKLKRFGDWLSERKKYLKVKYLSKDTKTKRDKLIVMDDLSL